VGTVAACNAMAANHPMVSAEILLKWVEKNSTTFSLMRSKSILLEFSILDKGFNLGVELNIGINTVPLNYHKIYDALFL
jgi:hypothetical protein